MTTTSSEKLAYSIREAARMIGVSPRTVQRRICEGKIAAREAAGRTLILPRDLQAYLDALPMKSVQS